MGRAGSIAWVFIAALLIADLGAQPRSPAPRDPIRDIEIAIGRTLDATGREIVEAVFAVYAVKFGRADSTSPLREIVGRFTQEEYRETVRKAARAVDSTTLRLLYKSGKWGEKGIKALLRILGETSVDVNGYLNRKADEYDRTH